MDGMIRLLALCLVLCGCAGENVVIENDDPPQQTVLFLGDSLTAHANVAGRFPNLRVIDDGFSSLTSGAILARAQAMKNCGATKIVMECGFNDADSGRGDLVSACANIDAMLDIFPRAVWLLETLPDVQDGIAPNIDRAIVSGVNEHIRALGAAGRVIVIDLQAAFGHDWSLRGNGGLHWTEAGYQVWHDLLVPYLGTNG